MQMVKHAAEQAVILIPSLEPDGRLPAYIQELKQSGFAHIVVVDDGSGEAFRPVFDEVSAVEDTVVLRHEVNHGKPDGYNGRHYCGCGRTTHSD